jgi:putative MATE family efflux protein
MNDTPSAIAPVDLGRRSLWQGLKDAIRGTEADYTRIPLRRAIFLLGVPMMLELMMESTFAVADIWFVGKLGASAIATVGLTETYLFLLYAVAMGLSMGITAIVARRIGEHDAAAASVTAVQAILIGAAVSLPFAIIGVVWAPELLAFMGADAWTLEHGAAYMRWMLGSNVVIMLLFVINAIFRGAGDAAIAMRVLFVANAINIVLDPMLIFGFGPIPAMGIEGAAIATVIGRGTGVALQLWLLVRGGKHIRARLQHLGWHPAVALNIVRTSLGGIGQMIIGMTSWIFLMRILASIGSEAVAGATIAIRILMFTMMPAWGMSNAAATLVGQNLGAGHADRAESSVWWVGVYNMVFMLLVSLAFFFASDRLVGLFSTDAGVIAVGSEWLRIVSYSFCVYGWWMVATQAFNGAGDTVTPTRINFVFFWLIQIPLCWALAIPLGWQQSGVFWGVFVSETGVGLFTLWLFTRGGWKTARV